MIMYKSYSIYCFILFMFLWSDLFAGIIHVPGHQATVYAAVTNAGDGDLIKVQNTHEDTEVTAIAFNNKNLTIASYDTNYTNLLPGAKIMASTQIRPNLSTWTWIGITFDGRPLRLNNMNPGPTGHIFSNCMR